MTRGPLGLSRSSPLVVSNSFVHILLTGDPAVQVHNPRPTSELATSPTALPTAATGSWICPCSTPCLLPYSFNLPSLTKPNSFYQSYRPKCHSIRERRRCWPFAPGLLTLVSAVFCLTVCLGLRDVVAWFLPQPAGCQLQPHPRQHPGAAERRRRRSQPPAG